MEALKKLDVSFNDQANKKELQSLLIETLKEREAAKEATKDAEGSTGSDDAGNTQGDENKA
jgi:hypothetical protein